MCAGFDTGNSIGGGGASMSSPFSSVELGKRWHVDDSKAKFDRGAIAKRMRVQQNLAWRKSKHGKILQDCVVGIEAPRYLRIDDYPLVLASVLIGAAVISIIGGRVLDRIGPSRGILPVVGAYVVGLLAMFAARGMPAVIGAGIVLMSGFMLGVAAISATVRNLTPPDRAGQVQGLRMVFAILVPMVLGPFIGAAVITGADETYVDLGVVRQVPTPWIFPAAAAVVVLIVLPVALLRRRERTAQLEPVR